MSDKNYFKLPRLFSAENLKDKETICLNQNQSHYLKNVMRRSAGDDIRVFDGQNGEWLGQIVKFSKKSVLVDLKKQLKPQPIENRIIRFVFSPIKKNRMDWMIEKMVELGVTEFQPVLFQNTEVRKINEDRMTAQIFEASEQCERFTIPILNPILKLNSFLSKDSFEGENFACLERFDESKPFEPAPQNNMSFLIGPEGGFTDEEKKLIASSMQAIDLGKTILRCETAAIKALILLI